MAGVLPQIAKLRGIALDLLFPKWCVGCGKAGDFFCPSCRRALSVISLPVCPRCGQPQPTATVCPGCASRQASIDGIRSPYRFDGAMRQAIHCLKYRNVRALASPLAGMLAEYLSANPVPADVLVPVPLHPRRLRERGYNQSGLLARQLSKLTDLPLVDNCLVRVSNAPPQARATNVDERRRHMVNAFACRDGRLRGRQVLLIDDVSTSGATLDSCAAAVKATGGVSVWALTVAREV